VNLSILTRFCGFSSGWAVSAATSSSETSPARRCDPGTISSGGWNCGACLPECPVEAIVATVDEAPEWGKVNADLSPVFKSNPAVTPRPSQDPAKKTHPNPGLKP